MTAKLKISAALITGFLFAATLVPGRAGAIEVKKHLDTGGGGPTGGGGKGGPAPVNPLNKQMQQKLFDTVANDSESFSAEESEKKASGKSYVDLDHAKFSYMPTKEGVTAKLEGAEYQPSKSGTGPGKPTGKKKDLIFKYTIGGNNLTASGQGQWQDVQTAAAKK